MEYFWISTELLWKKTEYFWISTEFLWKRTEYFWISTEFLWKRTEYFWIGTEFLWKRTECCGYDGSRESQKDVQKDTMIIVYSIDSRIQDGFLFMKDL